MKEWLGMRKYQEQGQRGECLQGLTIRKPWVGPSMLTVQTKVTVPSLGGSAGFSWEAQFAIASG